MKVRIKNVTSSLVGGLVGGVGNAVYDSYVKPMLPDSIAEYDNWVKIAVGVLLPAVSKNDMVKNIGNGLLTIGCNEIVKQYMPAAGEQSGTAGIFGADPARAMVGRIRRAPYSSGRVRSALRNRVAGVADPAADMVAGIPVC